MGIASFVPIQLDREDMAWTYKVSISHINTCNNYGRNDLFATSKVFERFCNQVPKVKYCHEFTKGHFSQSTRKGVIILFQPGIRSSQGTKLKEYQPVSFDQFLPR